MRLNLHQQCERLYHKTLLHGGATSNRVNLALPKSIPRHLIIIFMHPAYNRFLTSIVYVHDMYVFTLVYSHPTVSYSWIQLQHSIHSTYSCTRIAPKSS